MPTASGGPVYANAIRTPHAARRVKTLPRLKSMNTLTIVAAIAWEASRAGIIPLTFTA